VVVDVVVRRVPLAAGKLDVDEAARLEDAEDLAKHGQRIVEVLDDVNQRDEAEGRVGVSRPWTVPRRIFSSPSARRAYSTPSSEISTPSASKPRKQRYRTMIPIPHPTSSALRLSGRNAYMPRARKKSVRGMT